MRLLEPLARAGNHELAIGLVAHAQPSGKTVGSVWEALRDELLSDLHAAMPVQASAAPARTRPALRRLSPPGALALH